MLPCECELMTTVLECEMSGNKMTIYYDYTCPYSYRALLWLRQLEEAGRELYLEWKTFSLKEVNRGESSPSIFEKSQTGSVSVLALELAKAAQAMGPQVFEPYHDTVYDAMYRNRRRVTADALIGIARQAGLDVSGLELERQEGRWLREVERDHREGAESWGVFGTPTLVLDDEAAVYLKFTQAAASPSDAAEVYDALLCLARCHPELVEIKHPQ